jgi:hypothetical protein
MRAPRGPTHAPMASTRSSWLTTAIFERWHHDLEAPIGLFDLQDVDLEPLVGAVVVGGDLFALGQLDLVPTHLDHDARLFSPGDDPAHDVAERVAELVVNLAQFDLAKLLG